MIVLLRPFFLSVLLFVPPALSIAAEVKDPDPQRFSKSIAAFAEQDKASPPKPGGVVFVGSSSVRLLEIPKYFPGLRNAVNRGFGGSHISDVNHFLEQTVLKYKPSTVVFFCGNNDVWGKKSPEQVKADFDEFTKRLFERLPKARLLVLALRPSPRRISIKEIEFAMNDLLRKKAEGDKRITFLAGSCDRFVKKDGSLRKSWYAKDLLHMNHDGYLIWQEILTPLLMGEEGGKRKPFTTCDAPAEVGYGLTAKQARDGWISLFDGKTSFGWRDAKLAGGRLQGGQTTTLFGDYQIEADVIQPGTINVGGKPVEVTTGKFSQWFNGAAPAPIKLGAKVTVARLAIRPMGLHAVFNGKDLANWKILHHPRRPKASGAKWNVNLGVLHALGGPGAVELQDRRYGDLVMQLEVRTRHKLVNGGVFFRSVPGQFMNGYEAQVFNACYGHDPSQPARYSSGGIDDRQLARRLVSRDEVPFTMTIVAMGPHISTWVNGYQMTDWTDTRPKHENPREGLRLKPGTIQLQAHDPETDVEFSKIRLQAYE